MTVHTAARGRDDHARNRIESDSEAGLSVAARIGLAGRTVFYAILTALTIRIALLGAPPRHEADANGALSLVGHPLVGKIAIGLVVLGFVAFGVGRLVGAYQDRSVSKGRRLMTVAQGVFYLLLASIPAEFLGGNTQSGSQNQQQKTASHLFDIPGGRWLEILLGIIVIVVCVVQIRGALHRDFREGLDLTHARPFVRRIAEKAGPIGIIARSLVFLPIGVFLILAAAIGKPGDVTGTDGELLRLAARPWGIVMLVLVASGLAAFVVFSAIEIRYRRVLSAR